MLITLGRGLGKTNMRKQHFPTDPCVAIFYDSIGNFFRQQASTLNGYNDQIELYFDSAGGTQDMSEDGMFLLKSIAEATGSSSYYIDDTAADPQLWTRSTRWTTTYNALTSSADITDAVILFSGVNDANPAGGITKERYKQALQILKKFIRADFPSVSFAVVNILHRVAGVSGYDETAQIIKEAQLETIAEDRFFKRGMDYYDQDLRDAVHPSDSALAGAMAARQAKNLAYHGGYAQETGLGPRVASASFTGDVILDLAHSEGDDITLPTTAHELFALRIGDNLYKPSAAVKLSSNQIGLEFDNAGLLVGDEQEVCVAYGALSDLAQSSPDVILDNASDPKPLQTAVVAMDNNNLLWQLTDLVYLMESQTAARSVSGSDVTDVVDNIGKNYSSETGRYPVYSDGFLRAADVSTHLLAGSTFTPSATGFGALILDIPFSLASEQSIFAFGASGAGNQRTSLRLRTDGGLRWSRNETDGFETISATDHRGQRVVILWNFKSNDEVDFYINSLTPYSFNPRDSLVGQNQAILFSERTTYSSIENLGIGCFFHKNTAHDAVHDPSIPAIMNFIASRYDIDLV